MKLRVYVGLVLLGLSVALVLQAYSLSAQIAYEQWVIGRPGILYREFEALVKKRIGVLTSEMTVYTTTGVFILFTGMLILVFPRGKKKTTILLALVLLTNLQIGLASATYYRPRLVIPTIIVNYATGSPEYLFEAYASSVASSPSVKSGFVAALLGVGNPYTLEFVEIGWQKRADGAYYVYSSSVVNANYEEVFIENVVEGRTYNFKIVWNPEATYQVAVNGIVRNQKTFSQRLLEYVAQVESTDPTNSVYITFTDMKVADYRSNPYITAWPKNSVSIIQEGTYSVTVQSDANYVYGATINGRIRLPRQSGGPGGGYLTVDSDSSWPH